MSTPSADLQKVVKRLRATPAQIRKAQQRTVKKAAKQMTTRVSAVIREQIPLNKQYVDQRLKTDFLTVGDNSTRVEISSKRRGLLLTRFPYSVLKPTSRQRQAFGVYEPWGRGISVQVKTGRTRQRLKHAFVIPLRRGTLRDETNLGIAERAGGKGSDRTPLNVLHGKSISQAFAARLPELQKEAIDLLATIQKQEIRFALNLETPA